MNKNELIDQIVNNAGFSKADAEKALVSVLDVITDAMKQGVEVALLGFGSFKVGTRAARTGRNPRTGKKIDIPASKVIKFKAGKKLKTQLMNN